MEQIIELIVSLRVPDVVASTAFRALRDRLEFSTTLDSLRRHDYYKIVMSDGDKQRAERLAKAAIERTTTFVNPNKHSYSIQLNNDYLVSRTATPPVPAGIFPVSILVLPLTAEDETISLEYLRRKLDEPGISEVISGVLWELLIRAENSKAARETALDITVARARNKGLLLNPHYQRFELI